MKKLLPMLALCLGLLVPAAPRAAGDDAARAQRWQDLRQAIFGDREVRDGSGILQLDAPPRALDAALVPVGIAVAPGTAVKGLYLVIDDNPSPLAAHIVFGPAADPHSVKLRVRVDQYTQIHAVVETADGRLYATARFIKAAGGCSAPASGQDPAALKDIGHMKLRLAGDFAPGKPVQAQLMIRHPNFNGMQMDQITRQYTPAHFIQSTDVSYDGERVFHLDSDISLSSDPAIGFVFVPRAKGRMTVLVRDSRKMQFEHSFQLPPEGS